MFAYGGFKPRWDPGSDKAHRSERVEISPFRFAGIRGTPDCASRRQNYQTDNHIETRGPHASEASINDHHGRGAFQKRASFLPFSIRYGRKEHDVRRHFEIRTSPRTPETPPRGAFSVCTVDGERTSGDRSGSPRATIGRPGTPRAIASRSPSGIGISRGGSVSELASVRRSDAFRGSRTAERRGQRGQTCFHRERPGQTTRKTERIPRWHCPNSP